MAKIVLMGDSITVCMPRGIIGARGDEVEFCAAANIGIEILRKYGWSKLDHTNIDQVILLIGINNILSPDCDNDDEQSLEDVNKKLERLIGEILRTSSSRLLVQSIYPTKWPDKKEKILTVNSRLSQFCSESGVDYLDLHSILSDENGLMKQEYSDDGLHPNSTGYRVIASAINQRINVHSKEIIDKQKDDGER